MLDDVTRTIIYAASRASAAFLLNPFAAVIDYINNHLADCLTLQQLARMARISPSHFSHEFVEQFGVTAMKYIRNLRLQHASRILVQTKKTMRDIAQEIGFRDEFEFSRVFRRVMGVAPSSLRRQIVPEPLPASARPRPAKKSRSITERQRPSASTGTTR